MPPDRKQSLAALTIGLVTLLGSVLGLEGALDLSGSAKFRVGDNPQWASPDWDDATWESVSVPGSLQEESSTFELWAVGWYRIHFRIPLDFDEKDAALYLGVIGNADEAFLNGERVGGEGTVGLLGSPAPRLERVYRVAGAVLKRDAENVLAVRVWTSFGKGGLARGPVLLGNYQTLVNQAYRGEQPARTIEVVTLSTIVIFTLGCLLLACCLPQRSALPALLTLLVMIFLMRFSCSFYIYERGWCTHQVFVWMVGGYVIGLPVVVFFLSRLLELALPEGFWRIGLPLSLLLAGIISCALFLEAPAGALARGMLQLGLDRVDRVFRCSALENDAPSHESTSLGMGARIHRTTRFVCRFRLLRFGYFFNTPCLVG